MSKARNISKLLLESGIVKTTHLDKSVETAAIKTVNTKLNFNLGLTPYKKK